MIKKNTICFLLFLSLFSCLEKKDAFFQELIDIEEDGGRRDLTTQEIGEIKKLIKSSAPEIGRIMKKLKSTGGDYKKAAKRYLFLQTEILNIISEIENLEKTLSEEKGEIEISSDDLEKLGEFSKMLSVHLMREEMYEKALFYLKKALSYYPENSILLYKAALCSARTAKFTIDNEKKNRLFNDSEKYYLSALAKNPDYTAALYGLAVLYIFELDRSFESEKYLLHILEVEKKHVEAMFLLGRVYVLKGEDNKAIEMYEKIISYSNVKEKKRKAEEFIAEIIRGGINEK